MGYIKRIMLRVRWWLRTIRLIRGVGFKAEFNLFLSALLDTITYSLGFNQNPKTLLSGIYWISEYGFFIFARGGTDDLYHAVPHRKGDVHDFIVKNLQNGDVFIDVGANIGYYTLLGSKIVGEMGRVFAIEPVPQTVKVLKLNVNLNGFKNITVIDKAAWCVSNPIKLKVPRKEFGFASVFCEDGIEIDANADVLDSMLMNLTDISLIKIDVEGAEYEVLLGAKEILKRTHFLVIELTRKEKECLRILLECGFEFCKAKHTAYYLCRKNM